MDLDDDICCCHHVSLRKLLSFARRTRPQHASQMSDCLGAGTGCGWCIPVLRKIVTNLELSKQLDLDMSPAQYAAARETYRADLDARNTFDRAEDPDTPP